MAQSMQIFERGAGHGLQLSWPGRRRIVPGMMPGVRLSRGGTARTLDDRDRAEG